MAKTRLELANTPTPRLLAELLTELSAGMYRANETVVENILDELLDHRLAPAGADADTEDHEAALRAAFAANAN